MNTGKFTRPTEMFPLVFVHRSPSSGNEEDGHLLQTLADAVTIPDKLLIVEEFHFRMCFCLSIKMRAKRGQPFLVP